MSINVRFEDVPRSDQWQIMPMKDFAVLARPGVIFYWGQSEGPDVFYNRDKCVVLQSLSRPAPAVVYVAEGSNNIGKLGRPDTRIKTRFDKASVEVVVRHED